jgi:tetratricopeptide (TPR) repeat protein
VLPFHPVVRRFPLGSWCRGVFSALLFAIFCLVPANAADNSNISLDTSETLFTVLTGINACGYDDGLDASDPLRAQVRAEVAKTIANSEEAANAVSELCGYYKEHQAQDASRQLSQYISLALYLDSPPKFALKVKDTELPPDATRVLGFVPPLQAFYEKSGVHDVWVRHKDQYEALIERFHESLNKMMFDTGIYLRLTSSGYLGHQFTVYLEPMGAPGQINARVYGADYYVVLSPSGSSLKIDQIRHTYLHYLLDPLAMKRPEAMKRLEPLLDDVRLAPIDQSFRDDISLLVTECLIRAVEARTLPGGQSAEPRREETVDKAVQQGYILTRYFYDSLIRFEKEPVGFRDAFTNLVNNIDVKAEGRRASNIQFTDAAAPEVLYLPQARPRSRLLPDAEKRLAAGDAPGAQKLAQQALEEHEEDPGRAYFILAQVASMGSDMSGARDYFQHALGSTKEPQVLAWSHIYLGRIFDLQEERDAAVQQYRAALQAGSTLPEAKAAAERGLAKPYEPPVAPQPQPEDKDQ